MQYLVEEDEAHEPRRYGGLIQNGVHAHEMRLAHIAAELQRAACAALAAAPPGDRGPRSIHELPASGPRIASA